MALSDHRDDLVSQVPFDLEELKLQLLSEIALGLFVSGGLATWLYLTARPFRLDRLGILLSLFVAGVVIYHFRFRRPLLARWLLLLGPTLSFAWALVAWPGPSVPFMGTAIVIANAAVSQRRGFVSAPLNTALILLLARNQPTMPMAILVLWLITATQWVSTQGLYTVLEWAWSSHRRSFGLLGELRVHQGELNRTLHALQEATRRLQRTGHELAEARLRAQEARRAKERFAAHISHELRTPLNLIVGFSEVMYLSPDLYGEMEWPSDLRRDVYQIYQSSRQLSDLIDDVLDLSQVDAEQMLVRKEPSDLKDIIRQAVSSMQSTIKAKNVALCMAVPADLPMLAIDRTRIRQVLLNLLKNAARFTDRGEIVVQVEIKDAEAVVAVRDTGIGIRADELTRIFDEFHQVDRSLHKSEGGYGLGLAISKRFVDLHGGRIWAESAVGQGSSFFFTLPVEPEQGGRPLIETRLLPTRAVAKPSLILADRDAGLQHLLARHFSEYEILLAPDAAAMKDLVYRHHPSALLLNVAPGGGHDRDWQQALQSLPPKVPLLFCSIPSSTWMAHKLGVSACLTKPLSKEVFLEALATFGSPKRILIVDDDQGFIELTRRYLSSAGRNAAGQKTESPYRTRRALDGGEALTILAKWKPELILLDLIMPGMDGFEFLQRLRALPEYRDVPVVVVTASPYGDDLLKGYSSYVGTARGEGYSTTEVIEKLRVLLQTLHAEYPLPPAPPASLADAPDAPAW